MKRKNGANPAPVTSIGGLVEQLFQNSLDRFFGQEDPFFRNGGWNRSVPVNVRETEKTFELEVIAPGLKKQDFKLEVNGDMLTVSFDHKEENNQENPDEGWLRKEFLQQSFSRSFTIGDSIDVNKIAASYNEGILSLTLPKKEGPQQISRTIAVK